MKVFESKNLSRDLTEPSAFGIYAYLHLYKVYIPQVLRLAFGINRIRNSEMVGIGSCRGIILIGQAVDRAKVVGIAPIILCIDPI